MRSGRAAKRASDAYVGLPCSIWYEALRPVLAALRRWRSAETDPEQHLLCSKAPMKSTQIGSCRKKTDG
jgi:hypothetical protein